MCRVALRRGLCLLAQFLELILDLKAQLSQVFDIDLVFACTPVLRVGDTYFKFTQAGAIKLHDVLHDPVKSGVDVPAST